jgi:hypothetical protein
VDLSKSSKHLLFLQKLPPTFGTCLFLSFQTHPKRQIATIFQITALLSLLHVHQQANKSITFLSITQDIPKQVKRAIYKAEVISQWRRKWSTDSTYLLHKHHLSTIITCLFLRLSSVRILPRKADHEKEKNPKGAWVRHTHFHGKRLPSKQAKELKKELTLNKPLLEETHQSLSLQPILTKTKCNTWNNEAKTSISQSCASLAKLTCH